MTVNSPWGWASRNPAPVIRRFRCVRVHHGPAQRSRSIGLIARDPAVEPGREHAAIMEKHQISKSSPARKLENSKRHKIVPIKAMLLWVPSLLHRQHSLSNWKEITPGGVDGNHFRSFRRQGAVRFSAPLKRMHSVRNEIHFIALLISGGAVGIELPCGLESIRSMFRSTSRHGWTCGHLVNRVSQSVASMLCSGIVPDSSVLLLPWSRRAPGKMFGRVVGSSTN